MQEKIVKKHQTYLVLLLAVLFSGSVSAKVNNYVGAYGFVGEWTLRPSQSDYKPSLGVGGGAGFLYELQAGKNYHPARFLLNVGVGAWGGMTSYAQSSDFAEELTNQTDLQGDPFVYVYEVKNRHDQYSSVAVQVPLMIGFHYHRFYMLAGAKVNTHIYTKEKTKADITTYGKYDDIPALTGMPEYQFFDNIRKTGTAKPSCKLDLNLSLELGGRLGVVTEASGYDVPKRTIEYRMAAFVDYGISDIHTKASLPGFTKPLSYDTDPSSKNYVYQSKSMIDNLTVNDVMSTPNFADAVTNLMVGVKFTILFQLPEEQKCVICQDAYNTSVRYRGGGVKYEE